MNRLFYFNICKELIRSDLTIFRQTFVDKFIDLSIWVILTVLVTGYVMPYFGLSANFGLFQFAGVIAASGLFELYANVFDLVSDFEGDRIINYSLTLPIPSWMAILAKSTYFGMVYFILTLLMLPIGKMVLWNQLDFYQISYYKMVIAFLAQSIFYACFVLWTASLTASVSKLGSVWARFIFPLWFMGGFQFSWQALYSVIPTVAYINLLNPMIYITEATRVAIIGQEGYLPFGICIGMLAIFSVLCMGHALVRIKRRLDYV